MSLSLTPRGLGRALNDIPSPVADAVIEVAQDPSMRDDLRGVVERSGEFESDTQALLAGIGASQRARRFVDDRMDEHLRENRRFSRYVLTSDQEVIVGGGLHAAIYASVVYRLTGRRPVVLEKSDRLGGAFAASRGPSFYLNSRNRPGKLSVPGDSGALNYVPGSIIQPAHIDGGEYSANDVMAWVIRMSLMTNASCYTGVEVTAVATDSNRMAGLRQAMVQVKDDKLGMIPVRRAVVASGLVDNGRTSGGETMLSFAQFMARMDEPFPLRDLRRVAVIGAGDSGKCAIEALCGIGPASHTSVAALDWIEDIDWYGCPWTNCEAFLADNRVRYHRIGAMLPRGREQRPSRLRPVNGRVGRISRDYGGTRINERVYDLVIDCRGMATRSPVTCSMDFLAVDDSYIARVNASGEYGRAVLQVGPSSNIARNSYEEALAQQDQNAVAVWRYANRTALTAEVMHERDLKAEHDAEKAVAKPTIGTRTDYVDGEGTPLDVGDYVRVDYIEDEEDNDMLGTYGRVSPSTMDDRSFVCLIREDGFEGGGPLREWRIAAGSLIYVSPGSVPVASREAIDQFARDNGIEQMPF